MESLTSYSVRAPINLFQQKPKIIYSNNGPDWHILKLKRMAFPWIGTFRITQKREAFNQLNHLPLHICNEY